MKGKILVLLLAVSFLLLAAGPVFAAPVEKVDGFVCPHLGGKAGENDNSPKITPIFDGYTIGGPDVSVPEHATNWGFPSIPHGVPR